MLMYDGSLPVLHQGCRRVCIVGVLQAIASFLVPGAAGGRWCPLTQEPKLLAETLIAISSLLRLSLLSAARPARGRPPA